MRSFTLTVKDSGTGEECSSRVEIPYDEMAALIAFANASDDLAASGVMQQNLRVQLKIAFDETRGINFSGTLPNNDTIAALLHRVRPFVLANERMSYLRMRSILARRIDNPKMRQILERQRDLFTGKDFQSQVEIVSTAPAFKEVLNSDESFQDWLNAFEYHRDPQKREKIERVCGVFSFDAARAIFVSMLLDKVNAILNLAVIIRRCDHPDGTALNVAP
jgi:hypothetical protein